MAAITRNTRPESFGTTGRLPSEQQGGIVGIRNWGIVCEEDKLANDIAVKTGARLLSVYFLPDETILWLITEAQDGNGNRQVTTFLLPEEY